MADDDVEGVQPRVFDVVTTLAGSGRAGYADGGLREAYFNRPGEMCALPNSTLLVCDERNNCLRVVDPREEHAVVSTLRTDAFLSPRAPVVIDGGAAVVVCDSGHNKLRLVQFFESDPAEGAAAAAPFDSDSPVPAWVVDSTIAGSGRRGFSDGPAAKASFSGPSGLCVARDGSIIVADTGNHAIRRLAVVPGKPGLHVTTLVGDGKPGYADGDCLHARLRDPTGLMMDATGAILVCDTGNHAVRALHPPAHDLDADAWTLTTVAGGPHAGCVDGEASEALFCKPLALALSAKGELLVADSGNHAIRCLRARPSVATMRRQASGDGWTEGSASTRAASFVDQSTGRRVVRLGAGTGGEDAPHVVATVSGVYGGDSTVASAVEATPGRLTHTHVAPEFAAPGDIAMLHRRFAHVLTVAGPPAPHVGEMVFDADVRSKRRYADGFHAAARFRTPAGLCVLPNALGTVVVSDSCNSFLRLLIPRRVVYDPPPQLEAHFPRSLLRFVSVQSQVPEGVTVEAPPSPRRRPASPRRDGSPRRGASPARSTRSAASLSPRAAPQPRRRPARRKQPVHHVKRLPVLPEEQDSVRGDVSHARHTRVLNATPRVGPEASAASQHRHRQPTAASKHRAKTSGVLFNDDTEAASPKYNIVYDGGDVHVEQQSPTRYGSPSRPFAGWMQSTPKGRRRPASASKPGSATRPGSVSRASMPRVITPAKLDPAPASSRVPWETWGESRDNVQPPSASMSYDLVRMHHPWFAASEGAKRTPKRAVKPPPPPANTSFPRRTFSPGPILAEVIADHASVEPRSPMSPTSIKQQAASRWRAGFSGGPWSDASTTSSAVHRPPDVVSIPRSRAPRKPDVDITFHPVPNAAVYSTPSGTPPAYGDVQEAIMTAMVEMEQQMALTQSQLEEHRAARVAATQSLYT